MSEKDIATIVDLYIRHREKPSMIKRKKYIHFSYHRIKKLINKIDSIRDNLGHLPDDHMSTLFNHMNKW